jgi:hypothetical protein
VRVRIPPDQDGEGAARCVHVSERK